MRYLTLVLLLAACRPNPEKERQHFIDKCRVCQGECSAMTVGFSTAEKAAKAFHVCEHITCKGCPPDPFLEQIFKVPECGR